MGWIRALRLSFHEKCRWSHRLPRMLLPRLHQFHLTETDIFKDRQELDGLLRLSNGCSRALCTYWTLWLISFCFDRFRTCWQHLWDRKQKFPPFSGVTPRTPGKIFLCKLDWPLWIRQISGEASHRTCWMTFGQLLALVEFFYLGGKNWWEECSYILLWIQNSSGRSRSSFCSCFCSFFRKTPFLHI